MLYTEPITTRSQLGTELLRQLIQFGHDERLQSLTGVILAENRQMQAVCKKLGFRLQHSLEDTLVRAELEL